MLLSGQTESGGAIDRIGSSERYRAARRHDRRCQDHRAVHRCRHLDRMRHSRLPLAGRNLDAQPSDPVRRVRREPGGAGRILAPALCDGGGLCRSEARPRPSGAGIALPRAGKVPAVITQNIDNLHQASGFAPEHVVELHGNTTYARCIGCGQAYPLDWVKRRFDDDGAAPNCTACDEPVKTATIPSAR